MRPAGSSSTLWADKTIFEIRHKAKGSSMEDAVENGLENVVKTLEAGK